MEIEVSDLSCVYDLRSAVSKMMGVSIEALVVAEVYMSKIFKFYHDEMPCSDIQIRDTVFAYEVHFHVHEEAATAVVADSDEKLADAVTSANVMKDDAQSECKDVKSTDDEKKETADVRKKWAFVQVFFNVPHIPMYYGLTTKATGCPRVIAVPANCKTWTNGTIKKTNGMK